MRTAPRDLYCSRYPCFNSQHGEPTAWTDPWLDAIDWTDVWGKLISPHISLRCPTGEHVLRFLDASPHAGPLDTEYGKGHLAHQPALRSWETIVLPHQAVHKFQVVYVALPVQPSDREPKPFGTSEPTSVQIPKPSPVCVFPLLSVRPRTPPPPLGPPSARHPNPTPTTI